jgi:hypothetical protein
VQKLEGQVAQQQKVCQSKLAENRSKLKRSLRAKDGVGNAHEQVCTLDTLVGLNRRRICDAIANATVNNNFVAIQTP